MGLFVHTLSEDDWRQLKSFASSSIGWEVSQARSELKEGLKKEIEELKYARPEDIVRLDQTVSDLTQKTNGIDEKLVSLDARVGGIQVPDTEEIKLAIINLAKKLEGLEHQIGDKASRSSVEMSNMKFYQFLEAMQPMLAGLLGSGIKGGEYKLANGLNQIVKEMLKGHKSEEGLTVI